MKEEVEIVLAEDYYKIYLKLIQEFYESIPRRIKSVMQKEILNSIEIILKFEDVSTIVFYSVF